MKEIWKQIEGTNKYYYVSNLGAIKRIKCRSCSKLSPEDVFKIKENYKKKNEPHRIIAKRYGVIRQTISNLLSNKSWKKLESINPKNYVVKQNITNTGYYRVGLWINKKQIKIFTHKIVIESFNSIRRDGFVINHKDGNKLNNNINNLEYVTQKENIHHSIKNGFTNQKGENSPRSKLKNIDAIFIRRNKDILSSRRLADKYNVTTDTIRNVIREKTYKNV